MKNTKKIKLYIALFYLLFIGLFLYYFFSKFSFQEITSYEFIKNNRNYFVDLRETNLFLLAAIFFLFTIVWVMAAGFGAPIALFGGFIFDKWIGSIVVVFSLAVGSALLYLFANYFLKDLIKDKFLNKYINLENKFKKSEFIYLLIYRFIGGIPFAISNVLPCIFNVKIRNFFWATLIGIFPQIFLICSIGSGLEKIIEKNLDPPNFFDLMSNPEIYLPLIIFSFLILITIILRRFFYR